MDEVFGRDNRKKLIRISRRIDRLIDKYALM